MLHQLSLFLLPLHLPMYPHPRQLRLFPQRHQCLLLFHLPHPSLLLLRLYLHLFHLHLPCLNHPLHRFQCFLSQHRIHTSMLLLKRHM